MVRRIEGRTAVEPAGFQNLSFEWRGEILTVLGVEAGGGAPIRTFGTELGGAWARASATPRTKPNNAAGRKAQAIRAGEPIGESFGTPKFGVVSSSRGPEVGPGTIQAGAAMTFSRGRIRLFVPTHRQLEPYLLESAKSLIQHKNWRAVGTLR